MKIDLTVALLITSVQIVIEVTTVMSINVFIFSGHQAMLNFEICVSMVPRFTLSHDVHLYSSLQNLSKI